MGPCLSVDTRLLCALVNPRADEADLLGRERPDIRLVVRRRHPRILVFAEMSHVQHQRTFGAVAGSDNIAIRAAFERVIKAVELQLGFWFVAAVTFDARLVEDGFYVSGISYAGFR